MKTPLNQSSNFKRMKLQVQHQFSNLEIEFKKTQSQTLKHFIARLKCPKFGCDRPKNKPNLKQQKMRIQATAKTGKVFAKGCAAKDSLLQCSLLLAVILISCSAVAASPAQRPDSGLNVWVDQQLAEENEVLNPAEMDDDQVCIQTNMTGSGIDVI